MMSFSAAYIPVGVPTFHLESAQDQFDRSVALLKGIDERFVCPDKMLLTLDDLRTFLDGLNPDLIVFQNLTFANAAYMSEVLRRFDCPLLLWTLREPVIDGGRLRLNSLTGAYSAANTLRAFDDREDRRHRVRESCSCQKSDAFPPHVCHRPHTAGLRLWQSSRQ